jgi:FdrA protein
MTVTRFEIRPGAYADSIVLMQLQAALLTLPGVHDAGVVMATPTNLDLLRASDLWHEPAGAARPEDLVLVVRADTDRAAIDALSRVDELMERPGTRTQEEFCPRSLKSATQLLPEADWVLVSVPGRYAADIAWEALDHGKHVFLYSDNVPVEDEVALKSSAATKGLLVMGPDCGTAIINGVGLGFANNVRRGAVGLVGASGTGLQAISTRVHALGAGISQAVGTGSRDLSEPVGAVTTLQGLDLLSRDEGTRVIVLISKPVPPGVAARVLAAARETGKPVVVHFLGYAPPGDGGNLYFAGGSSEAAARAVQLLNDAGVSADRSLGTSLPGGEDEGFRSLKGTRFLRGLFAGGTLAYEAQQALRPWLWPLHSNVPVPGSESLADPWRSRGHTILDLGADEFTVGRLHPMMDQGLRVRRLRQEAAHPDVGLILLDVVLGRGAHPDPAAELGPVIREVLRERDFEVVVTLLGTEEDPQDLHAQEARLHKAGAVVFLDLAEALAYVRRRLPLPPPPGAVQPVRLGILEKPLGAINVGLESFYASVLEQGARAVHVDWRPPAGGDEDLMALLRKMRG